MPEKASRRIGTVCADTSFLIDFFKGEAGAVVFMKAHARLLRVSELVIYELLCGHLSAQEQEVFFDAMQAFSALEFNREAAVLASELYREGKATGASVGHQGAMIAGNYLAHGVRQIVARDASHFSKMAGVEVVRY